MVLSEPVLALQRRQQMEREARELRAWQMSQVAYPYTPGTAIQSPVAISADLVAQTHTLAQRDTEAAERQLRAHQLRHRHQFARKHLRRETRHQAPAMPLRLGQNIGGWPIRWAQAKWAGIAHYISPNYEQFIFSRPGEVIMLPFETLTFLSSWSQMTVVPQGINPVNDVGTGLDTFNQTSNAPWGLDPDTGNPYFDTEGGNGTVHCFVDGVGPYLLT